MVPLICCTAEVFKKSPKAKFSSSLFIFFLKSHVSACAKHEQSIQDLDDNNCNVNYMVIVTHFLISSLYAIQQ